MKCRGITSPQPRGNGTALPNPTRPDTFAPSSCTQRYSTEYHTTMNKVHTEKATTMELCTVPAT